MLRHIPNAITTARLVLAFVFFVLLSFYQYQGRGDPTLLNVALVLYIVAVFSDFVDGYLARRWKVESAFGRVVDPLVDKVLVLGSFTFFAGKNFIIPASGPEVFQTITGVAPGIVVVLLVRELLVTGMRANNEGGGKNFGAAMSGKIKMALQSLTIGVILAYVNYFAPGHVDASWEPAARMFRDICIWLTVAVTIVSGLLYLKR